VSKTVRSQQVSATSSRAVPGRRPLAQWIAAALAMGAMHAHAGAPPLSQAWLAAQRNTSATPTPNPGATAGNMPDTSGLVAQTSGQLLQQRVVQQSIANLNNAAAAVAAQISAQKAAQQAAQQLTTPVPDGITAGGLQVAAGVSSNPLLWQNASAPVQTAAAGKTTVQVKQTAQKAILTWDSFNIGRNTTLYFNQSGGTQSDGSNNWIALNRIQDPSGSPSQIFGQIKAEGTVYLLNRNGILFGAGSQVNTGSLLASSLNLFSSDTATSNATFLGSGINGGATTSGFLFDGVFADGRNHDVVIQKGASITTGAQGFALIAAPNVSNAGSVVADDGQAILAAGTQFGNAAGGSINNALQVFNMGGGNVGTPHVPGTVTNTGLIQARRGSVQMLGYNLNQAGVALASTSISYPGSIELNASDRGTTATSYTSHGSLVLAPGSVTAILPEKDGSTTSSTAAADAAFKPGSVALSGSTVTLQSGSLLEAPSATLTVTASLDPNDTRPTSGRIYVDNGAVVDVSGLANVSLPISALLVTVPRIGQNELADSPLLRNSFLYTQKNVLIDSTQSGITTDGLSWIGSPILNAAGYVQNMPRDITQMMTKGGDVTLNGSEVIIRSGAQLNLDGGYVAYQAGWVNTPNLLGANGRIYNISSADPNMGYVGFAGNFAVDHARWGITQNYNNPLLSGVGRWDPGFVVGSDAGSLSILAGSAAVMDGQITAQAFAGRDQVGQGKRPDGGTFSLDATGAAYYQRTNYANGIVLQQSTLALEKQSPGFDESTPWGTVLDAQPADTPADADLRFWLPVSADMVRSAGFANVNLTNTAVGTSGEIVEQAGTQLSVMPGGSISLTGSHIDVLGSLSAPSGSISIVSVGPAAAANAGAFASLVTPAGMPQDGNITVGNGAVLSTRGLWVNDGGKSADALIGDSYIHGGTITLATQQALNATGDRDGTGSILLQPGSTLDVSGGGYVAPDNQVALSQGVPVGHGGDITLSTYAKVNGLDVFGKSLPTPTALDSGSLVLGGSLFGYGFSGGGTLTLQAPYVQIGGDRAAMPMSNGLYLDPSFFAGQGFDNYALTSITDAVIAPGAQVKVSRENLLPNYQALLTAPTGTDLYATDAMQPGGIYTALGALDAYHRYVTRDTSPAHGPGFSLTSGSYLDWLLKLGLPASGAPSYPGVSGVLSMGQGAGIAIDAGGQVALSGTQATTVLGSIYAPGGNISLSTNTLTRAAGLPASVPELWLGAGARLDASGLSLINPWAGAVTSIDPATGQLVSRVPRTGTVLGGGSVSLTGNGGYVIAQQGSTIDVSGTADSYELPSAGSVLGGVNAYVSTPVWSDAGSITYAAAAGLYADATLVAQAGSEQAEGGNLSIIGLTHPQVQKSAPAATAVILQQAGELVPTGLKSGDAVEQGAPSGLLHFAADRLDGSGVTSLTIGPDPSQVSNPGLQSVVPLAFAGDVNLTLGRSFTANALVYQALPQGATSLASGGSYRTGNAQVQINAPYVSLSGASLSTTAAPVAQAGDGNLQVNADFIDLGGWMNLQGWANTGFTSSGDIRFYAPPVIAYTGGAERAGLLFTTGNLLFKATQIYPASDYHFVVDANGSGLKDAAGAALPTTVTILPNGSSTAPLSAGGALMISANRIEQQGTLRAPSGTLVLGVSDPVTQANAFGIDPKLFPLATTQSVHLAPGSLTSVSLDNQTVPYGTTIDGVEWRYNGDPVNSSADLTAAPSKQIELYGNALSLDAGAGIDVSGGGHLQAAEWVGGTGGTRDVLSQYQTSYTSSSNGAQVPQYADGRAIYAIIPGYASPVSAHDASFQNNGNAAPGVGQQIYLSGAPGLPAGYYTLLPAQYATLPGAYRVVQDTSAIDTVLGRSAVQPDGTLSVSGYFADALSGARGARNTSFLVQSRSVWQQYSQYTLTDADTFFSNLASKNGQIAPAAVADAGRLALAAGQTLDLGASLTATPANGGRGSLVDIAAQAIDVVGAGQSGDAGYLSLSADGLSALGAGSLLLGGTRQLGANGYQVTTSADSVVLANDADHPLQGAEILLAANGLGHTGAQGVVLRNGSALVATGSGSGASSVPLIFGVNGGTDAKGNAITAVNGDGALLRISQNGVAGIVRNDTSTAGAGQLSIGAGARVDGGSALTLDANGATLVDSTATLSAQAIDSYSNQISFIGSDASLTGGAGGFVIGPQTLNLLRGAQSITLRSRGNIGFYGDVDIDLAHDLSLSGGTFVNHGGQVSIEANRLSLSNDLGAATGSLAAGSGQLTLQANELDFGNGNAGLSGFGDFAATAAQGVKGQGSGGFNFGAVNVALHTPWLLADNASNNALTTTGSLSITGGAGAVPGDVMGGALQLTGGSVSIGTSVAAPAGNLTIEATQGDVNVLAGGKLSVAGINKTFYDTTTYAPGGALSVTSDHGAVNLATGSALDFSGAAAGGDAGSLVIGAGTQANFGGTVSGGAVNGYRGGYFTLGSGNAVDLDGLVDIARAAGATGLFQVATRAGNLSLSSGHTLVAQQVYLSANGGGATDPNGGQVVIDGTINAAGHSGSRIALFGNKVVDVEGTLIATSDIPAQRGGDVTLATSGTPDGSLNTTYNYENVQAKDSGRVLVGGNALINVSGGAAGTGNGGTVSLRAPLLDNGDVQIAVDGAITGARTVTIEPYAVWSTKDTYTDTTASKHFDGVIDPAGWYQFNTAGTMVAGQWTDASGKILAAPTDAATLAQYLQNDYFAPTSVDPSHAGFYGYLGGDASKGAGTLMSYVQQPGYSFGNRYVGIANVQVRPGIELDNPATGPQQGAISVLTNWNLGAGATLPDGSIALAYRYRGLAPILTVRAAGDLNIQASITDGFYQQNSGASLANAPAPAPPPAPPASDNGYAAAVTAYQATQHYFDANDIWNGTINLKSGTAATGATPGGGTISIASDPYYQALQAPLAGQSANYYTNYEAYIGEINTTPASVPGSYTWAEAFAAVNNSTLNRNFLAYNPTTLVAPQPAAYTSYADYVTAYQNWLQSNFAYTPVSKRSSTPSPLLLPVDTNYVNYTSDYATYISGHLDYWSYVYLRVGNTGFGTQLFYAPFAPAANPKSSDGGGTSPPTKVDVPASAANNSPSNMPSLGSPASLASATLLGGSSTSYRLVAGAELGSVDPLATVAGQGNVSFDGHFAVVDTLKAPTQSIYNGKTLLFPTTVRTGSGSIDVASGGDIDWLDDSAPATVYTAGVPADGTTANTGVSVIRSNWNPLADPALPYMLSTAQVNPVQGGDINLAAKGSINAIQDVVDTTGNVTKATPGADISQYWWPWMQTANAADGSASSINFANFDQGVMSVGGNVSVNAGGDIRQLSVSLPTTWYANADHETITTLGGGNLQVHAGGDVLSGTYFVAKGTADIEAGGLIGSDFGYTVPGRISMYGGMTTPVSTLLALQDAQFNVQARLGADIGGVYNPSYLDGTKNGTGDPIGSILPSGAFDSQSYSAASAVTVGSTQGNVVLDSLSVPAVLFGYGGSTTLDPGSILPSSLNLQALSGDVDVRGAGALYPSATGNLTLLAGDNVNLSQQVYTMWYNGVDAYNFGLIDASADVLPSALSPYGSAKLANFANLWRYGYLSGQNTTLLHSPDPLHAADTQPVRIYALQGDVVNGISAPSGFQYRSLQLLPSKAALVYAGRDIVDLSFVGQQLRDADVTRIAAGRDIYDTPINATFNNAGSLPDPGAYQLVPALLLGGPGSFLVEAGRNIGPLTSQKEIATVNGLQLTGDDSYTGVNAVGNAINPYLPHESADINVLFGVSPGIAVSSFMASYVDGTTDGMNLLPDLVAFMERREAGMAVDTGYAQDKLTVSLTSAQARQLFGQQPDYVQRQFVTQAVFKILAQVGADYNNASSPYYGQYARGYAAIDTLFPAAYGYTANGAGQGGVNGAAKTVDTGDLDIRSSTIQTQQGGNITILGPGGQALLGSASAPPVITNQSGQVVAGPNSMGVLSLEKGDINLFTDRSVLLAQSRIFTEQGGDLVMWSSNGDINAGQGAKTTAEIPPPTYLCTIDAWCRIDARGQVSGAGIATLQTVPGASVGNVYLIAPRGTVDAGDAGIRVSGNLFVAAAQVANADNIQVQGEKIGVPVAASVNIGALNAASAAANAVTKAVDDVNKQQQDDARNKLPSVISVQVLGFGDGTGAINDKDRRRRYDPNSPVQVLGAGQLSLRAKEQLTPEERARLTE